MLSEQVVFLACLLWYLHMHTADKVGNRSRYFIFQQFSCILTSTCTARSLQIAVAIAAQSRLKASPQLQECSLNLTLTNIITRVTRT